MPIAVEAKPQHIRALSRVGGLFHEKFFRIGQGFLIFCAGPEKHTDFLRGPLGFHLLHTLCYRTAQNETQISFLTG